MITQIIKNTTLPIFLLISNAHAAAGTYITEPFTCKVALANYHHLSKRVKEDNPKFVQKQLELSLEAVTEVLAEHLECKGVQDGK